MFAGPFFFLNKENRKVANNPMTQRSQRLF